jgi:hypothetical protein
MAAALDAYVKDLAAKKCVGLFYYAGHGIQLAWKNYMLPVDADLDTIGDVQKQALDVNAPLEDYLRRYPSGEFTELAQLQPDRVLAKQGEKRIQIASAKGNPYSKGSASARINWTVGDTYTYSLMDPGTRAEKQRVSYQITEVTEYEVHYNTGMVTDLLGNVVRGSDGVAYTPNQLTPQEFSVGKHWTTRYLATSPRGIVYDTEANIRIVARESVIVGAGTFDAFRIEAGAVAAGPAERVNIVTRSWYAPEVLRRVVAYETRRTLGQRVLLAIRLELASFKQS